MCDGEQINLASCAARVFTCDWDKKANPDALDLPEEGSELLQVKGKSQMLTTGFGLKFVNRTGKKAIRMPGDKGIKDIEAELEQRDGPPVIIGAH